VTRSNGLSLVLAATAVIAGTNAARPAASPAEGRFCSDLARLEAQGRLPAV